MKIRRTIVFLIVLCSILAGIYFRFTIRLLGYHIYYIKLKKYDAHTAERKAAELYEKQNYTEASELTKRLLLVFPQSIELQKIRGLSLFMLGNRIDGAKYLFPILRSTETDEMTLRNITSILFEERYFTDIVRLLERIPLGRDPELNYYMGSSLVEIGNYKKAIEYLEKSEARGSNNANVYYYLARAHEKLGNETEAITNYIQALRINPFHHESKKHLIALYTRKGLYKEAQRIVRGKFSH
ncbi:MAG: tetratricopeptide repeat protein [Spirochaetes bacterium]|nr:tetratricopeptide repeat protein [Spirochaetota bacterium]